MQLSEGVEWALHSCALLAALPPGGRLTASRLAEFHDLAPAYLAKHLQALARAGIVDSISGPSGGYRLARAAEQVTVDEVVSAVEGNARAFRCTEIRRQGPVGGPPGWYQAPCGIARVMWEAEDAWRESLAAHTVADLASGAISALPAEGLERAVNWLGEAGRTKTRTKRGS